MRILLGRVKGDKGERGAQGPKGPQGERGPQGPPGEPGQTDIYTRAESDARYQLKGGASVEAFYQWLKERNYDLTNFQGLEGVFPVKDFPELKTANLTGGDTKITGTGAPNTIVEYDGKRAQVGSDGRFVLGGITPLAGGDFIQITCYDYADRKKTFLFTVGKMEYAVPEGTTVITKETVKRYNLNRAGKLVFPTSVKNIDSFVFLNCTALTSVSFPACTSVKEYAFNGCASLTRALFPACTSVDAGVFYKCTALTSVSFPACTSVERYAFNGCASLTSVSFPACTSVGASAFGGCYKLQTVILSDKWAPSKDPEIPTTATVYNANKTKKVNWNTMRWVNV